MKHSYWPFFLILTFLSNYAHASSTTWAIGTSKLTYTISHRLKTVTGVSTSAKGKIQCEKESCEILVAVPVASFKSGDSNRDTHMIETTRGAENPLVVVRSKIARSLINGTSDIMADLVVEFAGKSAVYSAVKFKIVADKNTLTRTEGTIPLNLEDFAIPLPSFLTMKIENRAPIKVEIHWSKN